MVRGIIKIVFEGGWIREVMVDHQPAQPTDGRESYWLLPQVKAVRPALYSFGPGKYQFYSNRPALRRKGDMSRPDYELLSGEINNPSHYDSVVNALDEWVRKNLD